MQRALPVVAFLIFLHAAAVAQQTQQTNPQGLAPDEQLITHRIDSVKVYRTAAELSHSGTLALQPGTHRLVFRGLSQHLLPTSVQVTGTGRGVIQSVSHRTSYLNRAGSPRHTALQDSLDWVERQLAQVDDEIATQDALLALLAQNNKLGLDVEGTELARLEAALELYARRLATIKTTRQALVDKKDRFAYTRAILKREKNLLEGSKDDPTQEVLVVFRAEQATQLTLQLQYLVNQASWEPKYNLRAAAGAPKVDLELTAGVRNSTGIEWSNVRLTLSTADPKQGASPPVLKPNYISGEEKENLAAQDSNDVHRALQGRAAGVIVIGGSGTLSGDYETQPAPEPKAESTTAYVDLSERALTTEYGISLPYSVPADGQPRDLALRTWALPATYRHKAAPLADDDAFLEAELTGWRDQDLLTATANVYYDGAYLAQTFINPKQTADTLRIGLGRDTRVVLKRTKVQELSTRQTVGSKVRITYAYRLEVRNTHRQPISLQLQDQIPVSQDAQVEVALAEGHGAQFNPETGILTWALVLPAGGQQTVQFAFDIRYPKTKKLVGVD